MPKIPRMASKLEDIDELMSYSDFDNFLKSSGSPL